MGGEYKFVGVFHGAYSAEIVVAYQCTKSHIKYFLPVDEFNKEIEWKGKIVKIFQKIDILGREMWKAYLSR